MKSYLSVFALLISIAICAPKEENGILVLTDKNFQQTVKENIMFVEFYNSRQPETYEFTYSLERIKENLKDKGINAVIGKIDYAKSPEVARIYRIDGFPVLYFFKKGNPNFYYGEKTEEEFQFYMERQLFPEARIITSQEEIDEAVSRNHATVVGHFAKKSSREYKNYRKAAEVFIDYSMLAIIGETTLDIPMNTLRIYVDKDEVRTYEDKMTVKELKKWISIKSLPWVVPYKLKYTKVMFAKENEVMNHLLFFTAPEYLKENVEIKKILEHIGKEYSSRIFVVNIPRTEKGLFDFFGVGKEDVPKLAIVKSGESQVNKYAFRGEYTEESIREYIESFLRGELEPYLKSEEPYEAREGNVKLLVGKEFEAFVFNPKVNVIVEYVTSNCIECDKLKEDIETIAGYYVDVPDVDVARINVDKNDIPNIEIRSYPWIVLYTAGGEGLTAFELTKEPNLSNIMQLLTEHRVAPSLEDIMDTEVDL